MEAVAQPAADLEMQYSRPDYFPYLLCWFDSLRQVSRSPSVVVVAASSSLRGGRRNRENTAAQHLVRYKEEDINKQTNKLAYKNTKNKPTK